MAKRKRISNEERLERKLETAKKNDVGLVTKRAFETSDSIRLLQSNDMLTFHLRQRLGRHDDLPIETALDLLKRNEDIRQQLNRLNAEMCRAMKLKYRPPFGYKDPFEEVKEGSSEAESI